MRNLLSQKLKIKCLSNDNNPDRIGMNASLKIAGNLNYSLSNTMQDRNGLIYGDKCECNSLSCLEDPESGEKCGGLGRIKLLDTSTAFSLFSIVSAGT